MNTRHRVALMVAALVFAGIVGVLAYNYGVHEGLEASGRPEPASAPYYRVGHGGGPWLLIPLFFITFWVLAWARGGRCGYGWHDGRLDEWHRRAHERMWNGEQDNPDRR